LKTNPNPQAQYWAITSLWQLSFERVAAEGLDRLVSLSQNPFLSDCQEIRCDRSSRQRG